MGAFLCLVVPNVITGTRICLPLFIMFAQLRDLYPKSLCLFHKQNLV